MDRAYSLLNIRSIDERWRVFVGWATTPDPDRMQDSINPLGATFAAQIPLLHAHKHDAAIGFVRLDKPTTAGITFTAEIPIVAEPGPLKDRVDLAWAEIKHGLVRAVSIGFRAVKHAFRQDGGIDFEEVEILELSTVSVPANAQATITAVKAFDRELRAQAKATRIVRLNRPIDHVVRLDGPVGAKPKINDRVVRLDGPTKAKPKTIDRIVRLSADPVRVVRLARPRRKPSPVVKLLTAQQQEVGN